MPLRRIYIEDVGTVTLYKRRGARNLRLTIGHNGEIRVTLPLWAPYKLGSLFAEQRRSWLLKQRSPLQALVHNARIGKSHMLCFKTQSSSTLSARITSNCINVLVPADLSIEDPAVQKKAREACVRALKKEAKILLPTRLSELSRKYDFDYRSVKIKEMRSRWGSCTPQKDIVLNCYLMQLPWQLIDYVLLHELLHTRVLAHGAPFWSELSRYVPDLPEVRRTMRGMRPTVSPGN